LSNKYKIFIMPSTLLEVLGSYYSVFKKSKYEVITNRKWLDNGISNEVFNKCLPDIDAVITGGQLFTKSQLLSARKLKVVSLACSGYDKLDISLLTELGIVVTNTPIVEMAIPVADLVFGFILSLARQIPRYDRLSKKGIYERGFGEIVWGKTLGIIGMGQIGKEVAKRGRGFSMRVLTYNTSRDDAFAKQWSVEYVSLNELMSESDYISVNLRLNENTEGIISEKELMLMKPTSCLINTARKQIVDGNALYRSLIERKIYGAAIDFYGKKDDEVYKKIYKLDNVIATPHLGNRCKESAHAIQACAVKNVLDVLNKKMPEHVINKEVYKNNKLRLID